MNNIDLISKVINLYLIIFIILEYVFKTDKKADAIAEAQTQTEEEEEVKENDVKENDVNELYTIEVKENDVKENDVNELYTIEVKENDVNEWYIIEDGKCRYKGEWKNGLPTGKGIKHFYKTDSVIEGNFVDGFADGFCKQTFEQTWEKTVPYYEGEFKRNTYNGKGEYHYGDGDYYKGEWKDGLYHGQGVEYSESTNRSWSGEYYKDKKIEGEWYRGHLKSPISK
jgi:hypothetical protein